MPFNSSRTSDRRDHLTDMVRRCNYDNTLSTIQPIQALQRSIDKLPRVSEFIPESWDRVSKLSTSSTNRMHGAFRFACSNARNIALMRSSKLPLACHCARECASKSTLQVQLVHEQKAFCRRLTARRVTYHNQYRPSPVLAFSADRFQSCASLRRSGA